MIHKVKEGSQFDYLGHFSVKCNVCPFSSEQFDLLEQRYKVVHRHAIVS